MEKKFKEFYLNTVLANNSSYSQYMNEKNYDIKIVELVEVYKYSYDLELFMIEDVAVLKTEPKNDDFKEYSKSKGKGIPNAIINTHYETYLTYVNQEVGFEKLQDLIDKINKDINEVGKKENFVQKFREFRKNATGQSKIVQKNLLFGSVRDDYWTINLGAEKEIQYHIHLNREGVIRYGLGFNIQASVNNHSPIENVVPYKNAFYTNRKTIDDVLSDYRFWDKEEEDLKKTTYGTFILYGKEILTKKEDESFLIDGLDYVKMLYDLKNKQFDIYKLIFNESKKTCKKLNRYDIMIQQIELLKYKKQIILQGPPGTGKTREAKLIAKEMIGLNDMEELANHEQYKIVQFHPSYTYEDFVRGIVTIPSDDRQGVLYEVENKVLTDFAQRALGDPNNNYVLIIDEINRANLSSVLGELIYALEYRDEEVESMYGVDGDKKLTLPSNLYIIGTMNTADRSVGYIDYAIRRRFAFVDVLPEKLEDNDEIYFNGVGFDAVSSLFIQENISKEFEIKDVQIGHSYFIAKKKEAADLEAAQEIFALKIQYEVLPILREYIKDGILIGEGIEQKVEALETKL